MIRPHAFAFDRRARLPAPGEFAAYVEASTATRTLQGVSTAVSDRNRERAFLAAALWLAARGGLTFKVAMRAARLFVRYGDVRAASLMLAAFPGEADNPQHRLIGARLAAASGDIAAARRLADGAGEEAEVETLIADLDAAEASPDLASWAGVNEAIDAWSTLNALPRLPSLLAAAVGLPAEDEVEQIARLHAILTVIAAARPGDPATLALVRRLCDPGRGVDDRFCLLLAETAGAPPAVAAQALSRLNDEAPERRDLRVALAAAISASAVAALCPIATRADAQRKVFDVFPFFNEFEMLELKLREMSPWVDRFVIVESTRTFTGAEKPLHFKRNRARYRAYADKIVHVVVDHYPDHVASTWAREFHQRDMGLAGLQGLIGPEDLVIISDVDEIVRREAIESFDGDFACLDLDTFLYFFNLQSMKPHRSLTSVWRASYLQSVGLAYARTVLPYVRAPIIPDAGWHFTSVADLDNILLKLRSYSHQELRAKEDVMERRLEQLRTQPDVGDLRRRPLDERFPLYLHENREALAHLIL